MSMSFDLEWCRAWYWNYCPLFLQKDDLSSPCLNSCRCLLQVTFKNVALFIQIMIFDGKSMYKCRVRNRYTKLPSTYIPLNTTCYKQICRFVVSIKKMLSYLVLPAHLIHVLPFCISLILHNLYSDWLQED